MSVSNIGEQTIIVGGGAAGLFAARELQKKGHVVTILEANDRPGGRIHTIRNTSFSRPVEKGVEFIHGNLPQTLQLLKEAGIGYTPVGGDMTRVVRGEWKTQEDFAIGWEEIMKKMNDVKEDLSLNDFLRGEFAGEKYSELKKSVLRFAQGFDLADPAKVSVLALREEWMGEEGEQYRVPAGFDELINHLEKQCKENGCTINTSAEVTGIDWQRKKVSVVTSAGKKYHGERVIITVPLGCLQKQNTIFFQPGIPAYLSAADQIGFGEVVKVLLEFKQPFWNGKKKNIGFIFSDEIIPTWWTQAPSSYPLLTGWAGGPQAWPLEKNSDEMILELAVRSISNIFEKPVKEINQLLETSLVVNWRGDPFTQGAYSYSLVDSVKAKKIFNTPIEDTIFFAGEAFYDGPSPGTVEAALVSAKNVVEKIFDSGQ